MAGAFTRALGARLLLFFCLPPAHFILGVNYCFKTFVKVDLHHSASVGSLKYWHNSSGSPCLSILVIALLPAGPSCWSEHRKTCKCGKGTQTQHFENVFKGCRGRWQWSRWQVSIWRGVGWWEPSCQPSCACVSQSLVPAINLCVVRVLFDSLHLLLKVFLFYLHSDVLHSAAPVLKT